MSRALLSVCTLFALVFAATAASATPPEAQVIHVHVQVASSTAATAPLREISVTSRAQDLQRGDAAVAVDASAEKRGTTTGEGAALLPAKPLHRPRSRMPRLGYGLPRLKNASLPRLGHHLPRLRHNLPRLGRKLPRLGHSLPRLSHALPRLGHSLPRLKQTGLPRLSRRLPRL